MKRYTKLLASLAFLSCLFAFCFTISASAKEYTGKTYLGSIYGENVQSDITWKYDDTTQVLEYTGNGNSVMVVQGKYGSLPLTLEDFPENISHVETIIYSGIQVVHNAYLSDDSILGGYGAEVTANTFVLGKDVKEIDVVPDNTYVVDENNPNFSAYDGALYTKDYSELLHVPTERKTISLHENLDTIAEKAIAHCHLSYLILPWGTQTVEELSLNILNRTEDDYAKIYIIVPDTLRNWNGYSTTSMGYERFIFSDHNLFIPQKLYSAYNSGKVESESIPAFLKSLGYNSIYDFYGITPNSFKTFNGKTYYFDTDCKMVTGTKTIGDIDYTFDENGVLQSQTAATVKNGLIYQNGKAYYYENGVMLKSRWVYAEGNWYYLNDYGAGVVNCWRLSGGKYFYLGSDGKMQKNRWLKDYGSWYYLKANGSRYESTWAKINGVWYWFGGSGKMAQSQWLKLNGKWYYFTDSGAMAANKWVKSGAYWYYLGSDGAMLTNTTTPDGYKVDAQGRWK